MGAGPSIEKAFKAMDDEELTTIVQQAYQVDPSRMERILAMAKLRHFQSTQNSAAAALQITASAGAVGVGGAFVDLASLTSSHGERADGSNLMVAMATGGGPVDAPVGSLGSDRMAALWTFNGHALRELRGGNTSKKRSAPTTTDATAEGSPIGGAVDEEGYPVLYGSCGRDKKYARCSVCYFRGVRCNTAHYCACCQRPVCIRPRTYPGEEHPKICWNVLHMDKDMIQRVDKRRARKIHATTLVTGKTGDSEAEEVMFEAVPEAKSSDEPQPSAASSTDVAGVEEAATRATKLPRIDQGSADTTHPAVVTEMSRVGPKPSTGQDAAPSQQPAAPGTTLLHAQPPLSSDSQPLAEPSPSISL